MIKKIIRKIKSLFKKKMTHSQIRDKYWELISTFTPEHFSKEINRYESNALGKSLKANEVHSRRYTPSDFITKEADERNCEDFALIWFLYAKKNKAKASFLICFYDNDKAKKQIHDYHFVTVYRSNKDDKYYLADYELVSGFNDLDETMGYVKKAYEIEDLQYFFMRTYYPSIIIRG